MGVLNITEDWDFTLKSDYKVWWQGWSDAFSNRTTRDIFGLRLMDILSLQSVKYKLMLELGAMHSAISFNEDTLPVEYSIKQCRRIAKDFLHILERELPEFFYIEVIMGFKGGGNKVIYPSCCVNFDTTPFYSDNCLNSSLQSNQPRYTFYVMSRDNPTYMDNIIPDWKKYRIDYKFRLNEDCIVRNF